VDAVIVVCEDGELNGVEFRVQVKSSTRWERDADHIVVRNVKRSTLRYWFASPLPTMLVLFDHETASGVYAWHLDLFDSPVALFADSPKATTLRIPSLQTISPGCWSAVRQRLAAHYTALCDALSTARTAASLIPTVHSLAGSVRGLYMAQNARTADGRITDEQERLLLLMDVSSHREAVMALEHLLGELHPECHGAQQLRSFIAGYRAQVSSFILGFDELISNWNADTAVRANPQVMALLRPELLDALLDAIIMLTHTPKWPNTALEATPGSAGHVTGEHGVAGGAPRRGSASDQLGERGP
jgi:hypothetical protein